MFALMFACMDVRTEDMFMYVYVYVWMYVCMSVRCTGYGCVYIL